VTRIRPIPLARSVGYLPLVALPTLAAWLGHAWPRWQFMWAMAVAIYAGCKWMTWWDWHVRTAPAEQRATPRSITAPAPVTVTRHALYLLPWPGLDPAAFLDAARRPHRPAIGEWTAAFVKLAMGVGLLFVAAAHVRQHPYAFGWLGMIALVLILHFGLFHVLSCLYRRIGIDAAPLMQAPARSRSVAEFWGRRWNVAFRDATHRFLFKPLTRRLGGSAAVVAGFVLSGVVHELVITLPARGGYGLPTLYFAVQGLAMLFERSRFGRRLRGRLFTLIITAALAPMLFPPPFVTRVIAPSLDFLHRTFTGVC
jgi:alginate O-acetyltransferase complex protein AlgI